MLKLFVLLLLVPAVVFAGDFQYYSVKGVKLLHQAKKPTDPFINICRFEVGYTGIKTEHVNENRIGFGLNHIGIPEVKFLQKIRKFVFFDLEVEIGQRNIKFFDWDSAQAKVVEKDENMFVYIFRPTIIIENHFFKLMVTDELVLDGIKYVDMNTVIGRLLLYPTKRIRAELVASYTFLDDIEKINRIRSEYYTGKFRIGWNFTNVKVLQRKLPGFELGAEMFLGEEYNSSVWKTTSSGRVGPYLKLGFHLGSMFFWLDAAFQPDIEMEEVDKSSSDVETRRDNRLDLRLGMIFFDFD